MSLTLYDTVIRPYSRLLQYCTVLYREAAEERAMALDCDVTLERVVPCTAVVLTHPRALCAAVLDAYREAVVERVMAPDFSVSVPVEGDMS